MSRFEDAEKQAIACLIKNVWNHRFPGAASGRNQIRNSKYEYRNMKQFQMTKNSMLQTLRKPHLINTLQLCILKNEHKKQEVDGL